MDFSLLSKKIYSYLGFHSVEANAQTDEIAKDCIEELEKLSHFRYIYRFFETPPAFLDAPPYVQYLEGSKGVIVSVMTLGTEVDRRINYYGRTDASRAVVFDACASAYLEELSDSFEKGIAENLSYRFCPGYGGSDVKDVKYIFDILKPEKIGLTLTEAGYMLPSKSMAGVIAVGNRAEKNCKDCAVLGFCEYRKRGATCFGSEKK